MDDQITLDNWEPNIRKDKYIIPSKWRQEKIGNDFNQKPGLFDLKKINFYIKRKYPDSEIMKAFGINAKTLDAIKRSRFCPVKGIKKQWDED